MPSGRGLSRELVCVNLKWYIELVIEIGVEP
jgi:hypothetical protein